MEKAKYFGDKRSNHDWTIMLFQKKAPKECDGMRLPLSKYGRKRVVCGKEDARPKVGASENRAMCSYDAKKKRTQNCTHFIR